MKKYMKTGYVAKVIEMFTMSDSVTGIFEVDENSVPANDSAISVGVGQELEYFFTNRKGFHFVYHGDAHDGFGFWVHPDLVDIEERES